MRTGARRRRFIAVAMVLPFALVAAVEAALRIGGYGGRTEVPLRFVNRERKCADDGDGPLVSDPELFWRLRPRSAAPDGTSPIAASGFRTAFEVRKAPGVRRVVCLGDSNTFGLGVADEFTWPGRIERALQGARPAERWEVLNLGVPGYTSWQIRRLLETQVEPMAPDFVVIEAGGFNEWVPAVGAIDREQGKRPFWATLRVVELIASGVTAAAGEGDDAMSGVRVCDLVTRDYAGARRVPLPEFERDLRAIASWCAARDARVVFLVHPLPAQTVSRNPIATDYADAVRRVATDVSVPFADGWAAFRESGAAEQELFRDFCHPTERGYELLAPAVTAAIAR